MRMAIFGASGYQGRLVLAEAIRRGLEPVAIGRDRVRLRAAVEAVGESTRDVRIATVDDHAALVVALRDCAVVVNCAGPFTMLGPPVVRAAIDAGRHYVDTAGEQPYVASVFAAHGAAAERAGVSVVPAANDACLPDGPDTDARRRQRFRYTIDAVMADGAHRTAAVEGRDTYGTTAVIAVESARRLAGDTAPGGVLAAAEAFDAADLLTFLGGHGVTWRTGLSEA